MPLAGASRICQPIGKGLHQIPLFLLVDTQGLVCKCAGQAPARGIWPASFCKKQIFVFSTFYGQCSVTATWGTRSPLRGISRV